MEKCIQVFNLQQQLGVERNTISFNAVMSAQSKGKKPNLALGIICRDEDRFRYNDNYY